MNTSVISLTLIIVIFTCIISYQGFNDQKLKNTFLFRPASVKEFGEWYRFLTSGFLHGSWMHLGINMFVLYQFGESLERYFLHHFGDLMGRLYFLLLYFGAIIIGSLPLYIKHSDNQYYAALGASGGVSGVLFACIFFDPWGWLGLFLFIPLPYCLYGILYLAYESYMSKKGRGNIAHDAHIWGAVFGYITVGLLFLILEPELFQRYLNRLWSPTFPF